MNIVIYFDPFMKRWEVWGWFVTHLVALAGWEKCRQAVKGLNTEVYLFSLNPVHHSEPAREVPDANAAEERSDA